MSKNEFPLSQDRLTCLDREEGVTVGEGVVNNSIDHKAEKIMVS